MAERREYHASRLCGLIPLIAGFPVMMFGIFGLVIVGLESWYFFGMFAAVGGLFFLVGCDLPLQRLIVDDRGITRISTFGTLKLHILWEDIESWWAGPYDVTPQLARRIWAGLYPGDTRLFRPAILEEDGSFTGRAMLLRVRGKRWPILIQNYQKWRPSFDLLVADVRVQIANKEIVISRTLAE